MIQEHIIYIYTFVCILPPCWNSSSIGNGSPIFSDAIIIQVPWPWWFQLQLLFPNATWGYLLENFNHTELPGFFLQETRFQRVFFAWRFFLFRGNVGVERCYLGPFLVIYLQRFFGGEPWNEWTDSFGRWHNYLLLPSGLKFWLGENWSSWVPSVIATTFVHVEIYYSKCCSVCTVTAFNVFSHVSHSCQLLFENAQIRSSCSFPWDPCMVYLFICLHLVDFYGKCRLKEPYMDPMCLHLVDFYGKCR